MAEWPTQMPDALEAAFRDAVSTVFNVAVSNLNLTGDDVDPNVRQTEQQVTDELECGLRLCARVMTMAQHLTGGEHGK